MSQVTEKELEEDEYEDDDGLGNESEFDDPDELDEEEDSDVDCGCAVGRVGSAHPPYRTRFSIVRPNSRSPCVLDRA
jgi:hypothetical protein